MGELYAWVRNIIVYLILNTIIMNLLGNSSYKKYVGIVSGMILVLIVISPFLKHMDLTDNLEHYLGANEFAVEASDFKNDLRAMEEKQLEQIFAEYSSRVKSQVETILLGEGLKLTDFKLILDRDAESTGFGGILQMIIKAAYDNHEEKKKDRIIIEDIVINDTSRSIKKDGKTPADAPSPAEISIKIKLSDFYNIEPDNINISIQGG